MEALEARMQFVFAMRQAGVMDTRVLGALEAVRRDAFMEGIFQDRAYEDVALPIRCGQTISAPSVVGLMSQALEVPPRGKVLEIGTGSGYQAAILARLARRVYTVERHKDLASRASKVLAAETQGNVVVLTGDGTRGLPEQAPFDRIIVTAAAEDVPGPLIAQLAVGGILVMPTGGPDQPQTLIKVVKSASGLEYNEIANVRFVPLIAGMPREQG